MPPKPPETRWENPPLICAWHGCTMPVWVDGGVFCRAHALPGERPFTALARRAQRAPAEVVPPRDLEADPPTDEDTQRVYVVDYGREPLASFVSRSDEP